MVVYISGKGGSAYKIDLYSSSYIGLSKGGTATRITLSGASLYAGGGSATSVTIADGGF